MVFNNYDPILFYIQYNNLAKIQGRTVLVTEYFRVVLVLLSHLGDTKITLAGDFKRKEFDIWSNLANNSEEPEKIKE